jgi:hypothetical protein
MTRCVTLTPKQLRTQFRTVSLLRTGAGLQEAAPDPNGGSSYPTHPPACRSHHLHPRRAEISVYQGRCVYQGPCNVAKALAKPSCTSKLAVALPSPSRNTCPRSVCPSTSGHANIIACNFSRVRSNRCEVAAYGPTRAWATARHELGGKPVRPA